MSDMSLTNGNAICVNNLLYSVDTKSIFSSHI